MNFTYKQIWLITYPVMMSVLMEQIINITDAVFLGHVGDIELGASAIAGIYYLAIYMIGFGFSLGLQVLIARYNGKTEYNKTGRTFFQGLYFLTALAIILAFLSYYLSPIILSRLISSREVYHAVIEYIDWRIFGLLFAFPSLAFRSFYVGIIHTRVMTISALAMVLSNVGLNYILIFGKVGFPAMGMKGAAIASVLSEMISFLIFTGYLFLKINRKHYGISSAFDGPVMWKVLNISIWSMMHSFISVAPWFLFFVAIEHLGQTQLAIGNMVRSISTFFSVIVQAFAATTSSLVSNLIGAGESQKVLPLCRKILGLGYLIGIPLILLVFIFHNEVFGMYTNNPALIYGAFWPFVVMLSNYFLALPSYIYCNAVTGTGNTRLAFLFQLITIVIYMIYLWFLSDRLNPPLAVYWTVEHLFVILLLVMSWVYMKKWKAKSL